MTSVQNFLAWLKERSKKSKMAAHAKSKEDIPGIQPLRASSICRASLKLPPIPRQESLSPISRVLTDSPAHVYEEIQEYAMDPAFDNPDDPPVDIDNLDFAQAKEFGAYLIVPIKDKLRLSGCDQDEAFQDTDDPKRDFDKDNCDCSSEATSGYASQATSSIYPSPSDTSSTLESPRNSQMFTADKLGDSLLFGDSPTQDEEFPSGEVTDTELQDFVEASFQRLQLADMRRSHRGVRVVRFALDGATGTASSNCGDRRSICSSQGSNRTSSSNDTCNEYDLQVSDLSSQGESPKHGTPRPESDTASSLYAFAIGDQTPAWERNVSTPKECTRHHESDSSNDTFSEYDIQSDVSSTAHDDYEYHLTKVKRNLQLKQEVMRLIRESESEYETTSGNEGHANTDHNADSISLTTVSSMSDISSLDIDVASFIGILPGNENIAGCKQCKRSTKTSESGDSSKVEKCSNCGFNGSRARTSSADCNRKEAKKSSKKKHSKKSKQMEFYCLPDFGMDVPEVKSGPAPETKPIDPMDKLSCRATNFNPPVQNQVPPTTAVPSSGRTGNIPSVPASRNRLNQVSTGRRQNNRLLTDLMKMNHDRLLVLF